MKEGKEVSHLEMLKNRKWRDPPKVEVKVEGAWLFKDWEGDQRGWRELGGGKQDYLGMELERG